MIALIIGLVVLFYIIPFFACWYAMIGDLSLDDTWPSWEDFREYAQLGDIAFAFVMSFLPFVNLVFLAIFWFAELNYNPTTRYPLRRKR